MNKLNVRKILGRTQTIRLPGCTYHRTLSCWQCAYFEQHSPDSKGQCRCSYRGRWYYPHEGCTNGITHSEYLDREREKHEREQRNRVKYSPPVRTPVSSTTSSYSSNRNNNTNGTTRGEKDFGGLAGLLFGFMILCGLVSRIESCAADAGILKSDVTFKLTASSTAEDHNVPDGLALVNSEGERRVYNIKFGDTYEVKRKIRKGDYDKYLLEDRMAFSYGSTYCDGIDDYTREVSETPMEDALLNTLVLTVQVKGGQALPAEGLSVTTQSGDALPCTPYGGEGTYIVLLYDTAMSDPRETLTVSAPGYQSETVKVNFQNKRICEKKVNLSRE